MSGVVVDTLELTGSRVDGCNWVCASGAHLQSTVAGDMEMAPDQPRFMDETVVVESKAVAVRVRRATVHQRGNAPRHVVAATRSRPRLQPLFRTVL